MDERESQRHFADDPYSYRKYGAKGPTLSRDSTRHYFKCNVEGCMARKVIEISHADNTSTAQMIAPHDHPPPSADARGSKRKPRAIVAPRGQYAQDESSPPSAQPADAPRAPAVIAAAPEQTKSKRASAQNVSSVVALCKPAVAADDDYDAPRGAPPPLRAAEAGPQPSDAFSPRPKPAGATRPSPSSDDKETASKNNSDSRMDAPSDAPSRSAAAGTSSRATADGGAAHDYPGHEGVLFGDPRTEVVQWAPSNGTLGLVFHADEREYSDLYSWRKYGKKHIKGYSEECPRFYWRCTDKSCDIKRHTQATANGDTEVFYYGRHNHSVPERKSGRGYKRSPADVAASHDARPARTARRKVHSQWDDEDEDMMQYAPSSPCEFSQDSQRSDHASEFEDFCRGSGGLELPAGEGRCPLFFLACVAAKEPSSI